jgi:hypothetical protein
MGPLAEKTHGKTKASSSLFRKFAADAVQRCIRKNGIKSDRFQEALIGRAAVAAIGEKIELSVSRLNQNQLHPVIALDAAHLSRGLEACTSRRRLG